MKKRIVQRDIMPDFGEMVTITDGFVKEWRQFFQETQYLIQRKVALLCQNAAHPSLRVH